MGFLDKAKETISKATETAKDKIDDVKDKRKVDELLDDLGRITFRQRTDRGRPTDDADIARLVAELSALEAEGAPVVEPAAPEPGEPLPPPPPPAPPAE